MRQGNTLLFGGSLPAENIMQYPPQNILGLLCFSQDDSSFQRIKTKAPSLHVPMEPLGDTNVICELWSGSELMQQGQTGDIYYCCDEDVMFGVITLSESTFIAGEKTPLEQATESAYRQIFSLIERMRYGYVFRFWNYMPSINAHSHGLERYQQFNMGRQEAFLAYKRDIAGNVPAACALGFKAPGQTGLSVAFIAGRVQTIAIENPRQVSAYRYPDQYGPVSPTFSRASLVLRQKSQLLLVSGTASIVGHATHHASDAAIQTREAITNIKVILEQANAIALGAKFHIAQLHFRVYVRHSEHLMNISEELRRNVPAEAKVEYCLADICREDLLVEIEATAECLVNSSVDV